MPLTSSAIKALRQDRARAVRNRRQRVVLRRALKSVTLETLSQSVSLIDKATKNHLIHPNKAARLKSRLARTVGIATKPRATVQAATHKAAKRPTRAR